MDKKTLERLHLLAEDQAKAAIDMSIALTELAEASIKTKETCSKILKISKEISIIFALELPAANKIKI
jgi:hypothetical protein